MANIDRQYQPAEKSVDPKTPLGIPRSLCSKNTYSGSTGQRMLNIEVPGRGKRGIPQRRFMDVVKEDMEFVYLCDRRGF